MLLDEDNPLSRFLLRAYNTHCPFCMPGGFRSVDAVHSERASWVVDEPSTMSGSLHLLTGGLLHQHDRAVPTKQSEFGGATDRPAIGLDRRSAMS